MIVLFDGMRTFYEQDLEELNRERNFAYESWSSSLVTCFRLHDEQDQKHSNSKYYFQRVKRSEELKSRFKREADVSAHSVDSLNAEVEQLKARFSQVEEDKRTMEIKNAGLGEACTTLSACVAGLEAEVSSECELRVKSQHELVQESIEKGQLAREVVELRENR